MKEKKRLGHDDRINLQALHLRTGRAETGSKGTCTPWMQKALHPAKKDVSRKRVGNLYSAPKEKFGNSFGNRAVIFPKI